MKRIFAILFLFASVCSLHAQAVNTTVCEILKNPVSFNGKVVTVKGTVVAGFDQFVLKGTGCGPKTDVIWLSYPEGTKAKGGPAVVIRIQPAANFTGKTVAAPTTPVVLDKGNKDFKQFDSLVSAPFRKSGQGMCLGCQKNEVVATLTGRIDAVDDAAMTVDKAGKVTGMGGFGSMNGYAARLVLQSVAEVTAKEVDYTKTPAGAKEDQPPAAGPGGPGGGPGGGVPQVEDKFVTLHSASALFGAGTPQFEQIERAINVFPKTSKELNGVLTTYSSNAGGEAADSELAKSTLTTPDGLVYRVVINNNRLEDNQQKFGLIFAGELIADLRTPMPGAAGASTFDITTRAWFTTALTAIGLKQKTVTLPGGYTLWNTAWPPEAGSNNLQKGIADFLNNEEHLER